MLLSAPHEPASLPLRVLHALTPASPDAGSGTSRQFAMAPPLFESHHYAGSGLRAPRRLREPIRLPA
jgi:hypothetical protein